MYDAQVSLAKVGLPAYCARVKGALRRLSFPATSLSEVSRHEPRKCYMQVRCLQAPYEKAAG